jgi:ABC-2 type transport system permease protein
MNTISRMSGTRLLRAYCMEAKYETIRMLRAPAFVFPTLILPVGLFLLLGVAIFRNVSDSRIVVGMFTGFATFAMVGPGMFSFGIALAQERQQGILTLKRALPMPTAAYLIAKMLMAVVFSMVVMATLTAVALWADRLPGVPLSQVAHLVVVCVLGTLPFCALGLLIGSLVSGASAPAFVNLIYFPMIYLSGLFFPLPAFLTRIAPIWPAYHLNRLAMDASGIVESRPLLHVTVLTLLMLLCSAVAIRRLARVG